MEFLARGALRDRPYPVGGLHESSLSERSGSAQLRSTGTFHGREGRADRSVRAILGAVRRGIQIFITTHSLEVIDSILTEASTDDLDKLSVYRLSLDRGVLRNRRITGSEVSFLRTEIEDDLR